MTEEPTNAVLLERIANLKEDVMETMKLIRDIDRRELAQLTRSSEKNTLIDIAAARNADAIQNIATVLETYIKSHDEVHTRGEITVRWTIGILVAAVTAAGTLGLTSWLLH